MITNTAIYLIFKAYIKKKGVSTIIFRVIGILKRYICVPCGSRTPKIRKVTLRAVKNMC